jgi:chromosome segregation ATPase
MSWIKDHPEWKPSPSESEWYMGRADGKDIIKEQDVMILKMTERIQSLHAYLDLFATENAALKRELSEYKSWAQGRGKVELKARIIELEGIIEDWVREEGDIKVLKEENEKYRLGMQENRELRRHIEDYRDMNRERGNMIDDLMGFRQEYGHHVSSLENEIETLKSKVYALKTDNESMKAWTDAQMKEAQAEIERLNQESINWIKQFRMDSEVINTLEKRASVLEEKLLDAFMAGADWLERHRTGKQIVCYHERQKAMGFAIGEQTKILKEIE